MDAPDADLIQLQKLDDQNACYGIQCDNAVFHNKHVADELSKTIKKCLKIITHQISNASCDISDLQLRIYWINEYWRDIECILKTTFQRRCNGHCKLYAKYVRRIIKSEMKYCASIAFNRMIPVGDKNQDGCIVYTLSCSLESIRSIKLHT